MTKGKEQKSCAAQANHDGQPVQLLDQVIASRTLVDGCLTVLVSKDESNAGFGLRGVARSDYLSGFQSSSSVISVVESSCDKSVCSWSCPGRVSGFVDQDGERVFCDKIISSQPAYFDGAEWIMNLNSGRGKNNLWMNDEYPENCNNSKTVDECDVSFIDHTRCIEGSSGKPKDGNYQSKVSPVSSRAINIFVRHDGQTTTSNTKVSKEAVTKEGI